MFENIAFSLFQLSSLSTFVLWQIFWNGFVFVFFSAANHKDFLEEILQDQRYLSQQSSNMGDKDELVQRAKLAEQVEPHFVKAGF